ncbi:hypothetical protein [Massilia sp. TWP1-3-3]|uniref:hypothetical protein n=1 Tax=Massilia sp. TWP1-3-3 TaxID=2804573 RepID=UPI003CECCBF3
METKPILRDHSHSPPDDAGACAHCGQQLARPVLSYGDKRVSSTGLVVAVLLHVLLLLLYVFRSVEEKPPVPASGTDITYIRPLPGKPKRIEPAKSTVKPTKPTKPVKARKPEVVVMQRLPDTITLPEEKPVKQEPPEPPKPDPVPPAEDMSARIAARQAARAQERAQNGEESEADRGNRLARANIAAANGKSRGDDEETGVSAKILSFNAANLDFRGWDTVKKRRVLDRVEVELGLHRDIETACVKKMVQLMRQGNAQEVKWNSERLNKKLTLSVRPADTEQLENFLYQELFPRYRRSAGS